MTLLEPAVDRAGQGDLAVGDGDLDFRGVDMGIVRQAIVDVLPDALVRPLVAFRRVPAMLSPRRMSMSRRRSASSSPNQDLTSSPARSKPRDLAVVAGSAAEGARVGAVAFLPIEP